MNYYVEQREVPFDLHYTTMLDCSAHLHDHIELGFIKKGSSFIYVDGIGYELKKNDFFIVFPNQIHSYEASKNLECQLIIFSPGLVPEMRETFTAYLPQSAVISAEGTDIETIMSVILHQFRLKLPEFNHGIILALCSLVTHIMTMQKLSKYSIDTLKNILIFIEQNFTEPITVEDVAENLHISPSRLSHLFSDKLSTTFTKYVTSKRIGYACNLLKNSDMPITDIAFRSGFGSVRTFNRTFLLATGINPRNYREYEYEPMQNA